MSQSRAGRTLSVAVLFALVGALVLWLRNRSRPIQVDDPPEWPPLPPLEGDDAVAPPEAATTASAPSTEPPWRASNPDGSCPEGFPIKANASSGIFHVPDGRFYERTKPDRCYADAASAIADGYRQAKT